MRADIKAMMGVLVGLALVATVITSQTVFNSSAARRKWCAVPPIRAARVADLGSLSFNSARPYNDACDSQVESSAPMTPVAVICNRDEAADPRTPWACLIQRARGVAYASAEIRCRALEAGMVDAHACRIVLQAGSATDSTENDIVYQMIHASFMFVS
jgi:hypothetical protein